MQLNTIESVKAHSRSKGFRWFDTESMQLFRSIVYDQVRVVEGGTLFVTSEKGRDRANRRSSVRYISNETGEISTIGEYRKYEFPADAKAAMHEIADNWATADKVAEQLVSLMAPIEQEEFAIDFEDLREFRWQRQAERNPQLVKKVKRIKGSICEACDFDYEEVYGELGKGYIEAHHLTPISELKGQKVKMDAEKDFAVLCANCHRMIHRYGKVNDIEGFRRLVIKKE